jgi:hypothetical protein
MSTIKIKILQEMYQDKSMEYKNKKCFHSEVDQIPANDDFVTAWNESYMQVAKSETITSPEGTPEWWVYVRTW